MQLGEVKVLSVELSNFSKGNANVTKAQVLWLDHWVSG